MINQNTLLTPQANLQELGRRVKAYRINYPLTQRQLAEKSGVSLRSIQRIENGGDIQLSNLFRILTALELMEHIQTIVPDVTKRPSAYVDHSKQRQRVRNSGNKPSTRVFKWGDEE